MNKLISNPGLSHISMKTLHNLDDKNQLSCCLGEYDWNFLYYLYSKMVYMVFAWPSLKANEKTFMSFKNILIFAVSQSLKSHVDQPMFWIQKLDKKGQSKELHDAWIDLLQRIEKGSFLEQELVKCLKKWNARDHKDWPQESLNGVTTLHISAACGIKSMVEFISAV